MTAETATHEHDEPIAETPQPATRPEFTPNPDVQAYVTTVTLALAHDGQTGPYQVIWDVTKALESLGLRGVVTGIAATELRGDGGLIGL